MKDARYIFLSYSRENPNIAKRLKNDLQLHGYEVWMDKTKIVGGDVWRKNISDALDHAFALVWLLSHASVHSEYVRKEVTFAEKENVRIIPVMIEKDVEPPFPFHELHFIDLTKDYHQGLEELIESIYVISISKTRGRNFWYEIKKISASLGGIFRKVIYYTILIVFMIVLAGGFLLYYNRNKTDEHKQMQNVTSPSTNIKKYDVTTFQKHSINSNINVPQKTDKSISVVSEHTQSKHNDLNLKQKKQVVKSTQQKKRITYAKVKKVEKIASHNNNAVHKLSENVKLETVKKAVSQKLYSDFSNDTNDTNDTNHVIPLFIKKIQSGESVKLEIISYKTQKTTDEQAWKRVDKILILLQKQGLDTDEYVETSVDTGINDKIVYKIVEE